MYVIVEFLDTKEVEIIPESWQTEEDKCLWPPFKSTARTNRAVFLKWQPDAAWPAYKIRKLYTTDNFLKARSRLKMAEETSDLGTDVNSDDGSNAKRIRRENKRYITSDDDRNDSDSDEGRPVASTCTPLPSKKLQNLQKKKTVNGPIARLPTPPPFLPTHGGAEKGNGSQSTVEPTVVAADNISTSQRQLPTPPSISATEKNILGLLEELKANVRQNTQLLQMILKSNSGTDVGNGLPEGITLPLEDLGQLDQLEEVLIEVNKERQLTAYLGCIGGVSVEDSTRRILQQCLRNELAVNMNWAGKNGKRPFQNLRLKIVILNAVRKNPLTSKSTDLEIENVIKNWLRYAKDRDGGRKKRTLERSFQENRTNEDN